MTAIKFDQAYHLISSELEKTMSKLSPLGSEGDNISYNENSMDEDLIQSELKSVMQNLEELQFRVSYLGRPISEHGTLRKNGNDRYQIGEDGTELNSGYVCEVLYRSNAYDNPSWIITPVEYDRITGDYHFAKIGKGFTLDGAYIRIRR